ncbi:restriction endonuclease subunit S [Komagataeibacter intermedius]|uniref:Type I restriction modification DNA specificity domain-containing protein n=2 Tax=Komagataeibacter intermedius TaxID=66229 RepID=A0A0N1N4Z2_9PROT|nr:restriction endonuclease subunit S [Komagataeibacter intermedius]KPH87300.1 hypothetical protein GLUCOINTEAF2_0202137 [Komagataeibacter intermedius AF2]MCF3637543.1 restriction endonuclease subunit S [Komagataeibacter intermedius]GAN86124.1 type I restriction-modification methylase S subunit [Komagataeibacter intermedius TF2]GBQ79145.1 restriction endonuclease S subunit [Komagataeibacter intermedius NRIC 0521]
MSFPKYPAYKDSGVEWIGEIPKKWSISSIKRNSYLKARVGWKGLTSDEFEENSYAYLVTGSDFRGSEIQWQNCYQVDKSRYDDDPFIHLKNGDLLITKDGTIGKLSIVKELDKPACLNSGIFILRPLNSYSNNFMKWVLESKVFKVFVDFHSHGSTINHLYQNVFENFSFPLPPLPEQQAIASFLDRECGKIDALIAEQERLIALLAEKRQAVISHAVTKGLNPDAPMKDSGIPWIGMVPEEWEVHPLKNVASVQTGIAKGKEANEQKSVQVPYLRVANVQDGYLDLSEVSSINIDREQVERYLLRQGDVLMNEGGDFDKLGRGAIWHGEISSCIHQNHVFAVRPKSIISEWLAAVIGSDYAKFYFMTRSKQSTNLASISSTNLMMLPTIVPSIEEQKVLVSFLENKKSQFENLTNSANSIITLLKERRAALISAAVTGKIDVRAHSKVLAA